jgi:hypothetical protein
MVPLIASIISGSRACSTAADGVLMASLMAC